MRTWSKAKESKDIDKMNEVFDTLFKWWENDSLDKDVYDAIFDGDWPSSVRQLEVALVKAKAKQKDREEA